MIWWGWGRGKETTASCLDPAVGAIQLQSSLRGPAEASVVTAPQLILSLRPSGDGGALPRKPPIDRLPSVCPGKLPMGHMWPLHFKGGGQ